jgi:hypothetical protein
MKSGSRFTSGAPGPLDGLSLPLADVDELLSSGQLQVIDANAVVPANYRLLPAAGSEGQMVIANDAFYRFANWAEEFNDIQQHQSTGARTFAETIRRLDEFTLRDPRKLRKLKAAGYARFADTEVVKLPNLGQHAWIPLVSYADYYRRLLMVLIAEIDRQFNPTLLVEIGSGPGDLMVSYVREYLRSGAHYECWELAVHGLGTARLLAQAAGLTSITMAQVDLRSPDLTQFKPDERILFFCSGTFCLLGDAISHFLEKLCARGQKFKLCLFEPISYQLKAVFPKMAPMTSEKSAQYLKLDAPIWPAVQSFEKSGAITVDNLIPDIVGKSPLYPMSFVSIGGRA